MQQLFVEQRNLPTNPPATIAADISHHLQRRQYLGTALVVTDTPNPILSAVRKQWLKGSRHLQKLRASTLNAEEILRLTHAIMHMQNVDFTSKLPSEQTDAKVFFADTSHVEVPANCYTLYVTTNVPPDHLKTLCKKLPHDALIVAYAPGVADGLHLEPKTTLEQNVLAEWDTLAAFLRQHAIEPHGLVVGNNLQFDAMDNALDTLLGVGIEFLRQTAIFQHSINLAQPFTIIPAEQQKMFEAVTRLAHRVQSLTPGNFNSYLVNNFGDSSGDVYFLRDVGSQLYLDLEAAAQAAGAPAP